ncbi:MAG: lamin tail domain-containing protein [Cyclobacteriaceae bacterium]
MRSILIIILLIHINTTSFAVDRFDVLINEIMFAPSDITPLPKEEYVELYNTTTDSIDISNWKLYEGENDKSPFTIKSGIIAPNGYFILSKKDFSTYGDNYYHSSFPSLNNSGEAITLYSDDGRRIHHIKFSPDFYNDEVRDNGGWSVELIDHSNPCGRSSNWMASQHNIGGTPGKENSVIDNNPDIVPPQVEAIYPIDSSSVYIRFNEEIDSSTLANNSYYSLASSSIQVLSNSYDEITLQLDTPLIIDSMYQLTVTTSDCQLNEVNLTKPLALPHYPTQTSALKINELLYDPYAGGTRFLEFISTDYKVYDLGNLLIAEVDENGALTSTPLSLSDESKLLFPNQHYVLTENTENISSTYTVAHHELLIEIKNFPALDNTENGIALLNDSLIIIDFLYYHKDFHYDGYSSSETEGISLERIKTNMPTNEPSNWFSAAESVGFATPTNTNSQHIRTEAFVTENFKPMQAVFSPDNDGIDDLAIFPYSFSKGGSTISFSVLTLTGQEIKEIANNESAATQGFYSWDGTKEDGSRVNIGIYIALISVFSSSGETESYKYPIVVGGKL